MSKKYIEVGVTCFKGPEFLINTRGRAFINGNTIGCGVCGAMFPITNRHLIQLRKKKRNLVKRYSVKKGYPNAHVF